LRANVTPALAHVIDGCLNKDPEQRWQSAGDISRELKWISNAAPEAAIASTPRPAKQVLVYGGVAALLLIATIVLAVKLLTRTPAEQWKLQSDSDKHDVVDAESAAIQLSPDGSKASFVESLQVATSPCCRRDLPDVISVNPSLGAWAPVTAVSRSAHACFFLHVIGLPPYTIEVGFPLVPVKTIS
jgi:hypothetical protein